MELRLKQSVVDCCLPVFSQTIRKEESQDAVVPDTMPDIGAIVSTAGNVLIRSKDVGDGRVRLEANVPAKVTYEAEEGGALSCMDVNIPLYVSFEDENITSQGLCCADIDLVALDTKVLNPRKICVRAEAAFHMDCYVPSQMTFSAAPEEAAEGINLRERQIETSAVCAVTEKSFVLTDEFAVPDAMPPMSVILRQQTLPQVEDVQTVGSKLVVKGSVRSSLLYLSGEAQVGAVEFSTAFSQVVEADALPEDPHIAADVLLSGAYYDITGEGRTGEMEAHLVIQATVSGSRKEASISDAYSNRYPLETEVKPVRAECIASELTLRETLREQLPTVQPPTEILQGSFDLGAAQVDDGTVLLPVTVCACYRCADGRLQTAKRTWQVRFCHALSEGESLSVAGVCAQELYLSPSAEGIDVRLPLEVRAFLLHAETVDCVTAIRCDDAATLDLSEEPTLVILRADSGDDLWEIAKANHSTVRAIAEANGLDAAAGNWEKLILIPKTV